MIYQGKVVIVTGGSSGIGASTAVQFAKEGAHVVIVGRNDTKLKSVLEKCGSKSVVVKADISKSGEIKRIVDTAMKNYGKIDILVNNAGFSKTADLLSENFMSNFDDVMNVNFRAVVEMTHVCTPHLITSKGNIVNISSIAAVETPALPGLSPYCVSKAALDHFTRCMAYELADKGVRVNGINPGPVRTDFAENMGMSPSAVKMFFNNYEKITPLKRISEPEEIADLVLYLASDKAKGITGSTIFSDNGMMLDHKRKF